MFWSTCWKPEPDTDVQADVTSSEASMTQIKESIKVKKRASDVSFYLIKAVVLTVNDERTAHLRGSSEQTLAARTEIRENGNVSSRNG